MIKAIIFDLNGIFIQSPKLSERFREEFGVALDEFLPVLKEIMAKVRMPNAGDSFLYWKPYLGGWDVNLMREEFFNFWFNAEKEVPKMITLGKELKTKGIKLFILSNNFVERAEYYKSQFLWLQEIFDKIYYSWQTGFVKPSAEAYILLLTENNLKSEECTYFDDSEENVQVANSLGIKSYVFEGPEQVRKVIAAA